MLAVASFHHTVGLRMVGGGEAVLDTLLLADVGPDGGGELMSLVRGELSWHAKAHHPCGDEGIGAHRGLHVLEGDSLNPAGSAINHREEVSAAIVCCGERANQVHLVVQEALVWHGDGLDGRGWLLGDFGALAVLTIMAPGKHSLFMPSQMTRAANRPRVAHIPGCTSWWKVLQNSLAVSHGDELPGLRQADVTENPDKLDQLELRGRPLGSLH